MNPDYKLPDAMTDPPTCPACGALLAQGRGGDLCPACLLHAAMGTEAPPPLDSFGVSPLAHAAAAGKTASMAALLAHGAPPDATRPNEKPPVWVAASVGQLRAVHALLAAGANPDASNPLTKTTALDVAKSRGDQPMVKLLENHPPKK